MHTPHPDTVVLSMKDGKQYKTSVTFSHFADGDTHCIIEDTAHIKGAKVLVKHYLYPNQNEQIVRLLFLLGALKDLGASIVEVLVPYLPYARQDKAHLPGEVISSRLLCRLIKDSGASSLYTIDCHFMKGASRTEVEGLSIHNVLVNDALLAHLATLTSEPYQLIGPDAGASYLAYGGTMKKARAKSYGRHSDGSIHRVVATLDDTHLKLDDKAVVVADDMISTGDTMMKALKALQARGISNLYVLTTHGLFLQDSFEKIKKLATDVIYSDTIATAGSVLVVDEIFDKIVNQYL